MRSVDSPDRASAPEQRTVPLCSRSAAPGAGVTGPRLASVDMGRMDASDGYSRASPLPERTKPRPTLHQRLKLGEVEGGVVAAVVLVPVQVQDLLAASGGGTGTRWRASTAGFTLGPGPRPRSRVVQLAYLATRLSGRPVPHTTRSTRSKSSAMVGSVNRPFIIGG